MAEPEREFVLIQDDDCHWYVCPADRQDEAESYFREYAGWAQDDNWEEFPTDEPEMPEWLERVGGAPTLVRFTGYRIA